MAVRVNCNSIYAIDMLLNRLTCLFMLPVKYACYIVQMLDLDVFKSIVKAAINI